MIISLLIIALATASAVTSSPPLDGVVCFSQSGQSYCPWNQTCVSNCIGCSGYELTLDWHESGNNFTCSEPNKWSCFNNTYCPSSGTCMSSDLCLPNCVGHPYISTNAVWHYSECTDIPTTTPVTPTYEDPFPTNYYIPHHQAQYDISNKNIQGLFVTEYGMIWLQSDLQNTSFIQIQDHSTFETIKTVQFPNSTHEWTTLCRDPNDFSRFFAAGYYGQELDILQFQYDASSSELNATVLTIGLPTSIGEVLSMGVLSIAGNSSLCAAFIAADAINLALISDFSMSGVSMWRSSTPFREFHYTYSTGHVLGTPKYCTDQIVWTYIDMSTGNETQGQIEVYGPGTVYVHEIIFSDDSYYIVSQGNIITISKLTVNSTTGVPFLSWKTSNPDDGSSYYYSGIVADSFSNIWLSYTKYQASSVSHRVKLASSDGSVHFDDSFASEVMVNGKIWYHHTASRFVGYSQLTSASISTYVYDSNWINNCTGNSHTPFVIEFYQEDITFHVGYNVTNAFAPWNSSSTFNFSHNGNLTLNSYWNESTLRQETTFPETIFQYCPSDDRYLCENEDCYIGQNQQIYPTHSIPQIDRMPFLQFADSGSLFHDESSYEHFLNPSNGIFLIQHSGASLLDEYYDHIIKVTPYEDAFGNSAATFYELTSRVYNTFSPTGYNPSDFQYFTLTAANEYIPYYITWNSNRELLDPSGVKPLVRFKEQRLRFAPDSGEVFFYDTSDCSSIGLSMEYFATNENINIQVINMTLFLQFIDQYYLNSSVTFDFSNIQFLGVDHTGSTTSTSLIGTAILPLNGSCEYFEMDLSLWNGSLQLISENIPGTTVYSPTSWSHRPSDTISFAWSHTNLAISDGFELNNLTGEIRVTKNVPLSFVTKSMTVAVHDLGIIGSYQPLTYTFNYTCTSLFDFSYYGKNDLYHGVEIDDHSSSDAQTLDDSLMSYPSWRLAYGRSEFDEICGGFYGSNQYGCKFTITDGEIPPGTTFNEFGMLEGTPDLVTAGNLEKTEVYHYNASVQFILDGKVEGVAFMETRVIYPASVDYPENFVVSNNTLVSSSNAGSCDSSINLCPVVESGNSLRYTSLDAEYTVNNENGIMDSYPNRGVGYQSFLVEVKDLFKEKSQIRIIFEVTNPIEECSLVVPTSLFLSVGHGRPIEPIFPVLNYYSNPRKFVFSVINNNAEISLEYSPTTGEIFGVPTEMSTGMLYTIETFEVHSEGKDFIDVDFKLECFDAGVADFIDQTVAVGYPVRIVKALSFEYPRVLPLEGYSLPEFLPNGDLNPTVNFAQFTIGHVFVFVPRILTGYTGSFSSSRFQQFWTDNPNCYLEDSTGRISGIPSSVGLYANISITGHDLGIHSEDDGMEVLITIEIVSDLTIDVPSAGLVTNQERSIRKLVFSIDEFSSYSIGTGGGAAFGYQLRYKTLTEDQVEQWDEWLTLNETANTIEGIPSSVAWNQRNNKSVSLMTGIPEEIQLIGFDIGSGKEQFVDLQIEVVALCDANIFDICEDLNRNPCVSLCGPTGCNGANNQCGGCKYGFDVELGVTDNWDIHCDTTLNTWQLFIMLLIIAIIAGVAYWWMNKYYPRTDIAEVAICFICTFDEATDLAFLRTMYSRSFADPSDPYYFDLTRYYYASLLFIVIPLLCNVYSAFLILKDEFSRPVFRKYFDTYPKIATVGMVLSAFEVNCLGVLKSNFLHLPAFSCPYAAESVQKYETFAVWSLLLEDIPQLIIQMLVVDALGGFESSDIILLINFSSTLIAIVFGLTRKLLLWCLYYKDRQARVSISGSETLNVFFSFVQYLE